ILSPFFLTENPTLSEGANFTNEGALSLQSLTGGIALPLNDNTAFHNSGLGVGFTGTLTILDSSWIGWGRKAIFNNNPGGVFERKNVAGSVSVISVPFLNLGDKKPGGNIKFTNPRQSGAQGKLELNGETITAVAPFVIDGGLILGSGTLVG